MKVMTDVLKTISDMERDVTYDVEANHVAYVISYDELEHAVIIKEADTYYGDVVDGGIIETDTTYYTIDIIKNVSIKDYVTMVSYFFNNMFVLKHEYAFMNKIVFDDDVTIIS